MKNNFLFASFFLAILCITFMACNDDDDGGNTSNSNKIVGTWVLDTRSSQNSSIGADWTDSPFAYRGIYNIYSHIQFFKDGSCIKVTKLDPYSRDDKPSIFFGKYRTSNKKLTFIDENVESEYEYNFEDSKLYLTLVEDGQRIEFVYNHAEDSEMDDYYTKGNKDYLNSYEVDMGKYLQDDNVFERYKVDMSKYEVDISNFKVNLNTKIPKFSCPDNRHPHAIDMGAAGKWACCNVGADNPAQSGGYYAWGETEVKTRYEKLTYQHFDKMKGYIDIGNDIAGSRFDVAYMKWGGDWIMPSYKRIDALLKNCTTQWTEFDMFGTADTDNCYRINGNIYRLDNIDSDLNYFLIDDKLYKLDDSFRFDSYYINGEFYNRSSMSNYYLINGKYYNIPSGIQKRLYIIDNKVYDIFLPDYMYVKGNDIYFVSDANVYGISALPATQLYQSKYAIDNRKLDKYVVRLSKLKINNHVSGVILTSKDTKKSIFIPNAGGMFSGDIEVAGYGLFGKYWSSTFYNKEVAYTLGLQNPDVSMSNGLITEGYLVRPIVR